MLVKRTKGRPKRDSGDAGRDRLIAAAVEVLRQPQIDLNRKDIASRAGVTPALVSYYFEDQPSLIEAVAQPLVDQHLAELTVTLQTDIAVEKKLHLLVRLLLRIGRSDGRLLDGYVDFVRRTQDSRFHFLGSAQRELTAFFRQCEAEGYFRPTDTAFAQAVLWGTCKIVAQTFALGAAAVDQPAGETDFEERQVAMVVDLLLNGFGGRGRDGGSGHG